MGFWDRLTRLEDRIDPVRVALCGEDSNERPRLETAYLQNPKAKVVAAGGADQLEKILQRGQAEWVEIFAGIESRAGLAGKCLAAGVNVSLPMPPAATPAEIQALQEKAAARGLRVRVRNPLLYYQPYQKAKELLEQEKIGYATLARLAVKRNQVPDRNFDRAKWILERESGYLALAQYFYGPIEEIFRLDGTGGETGPGSLLLGFKFQARHKFGYLLADFAPDLQIRTFTEPVFRQVWLTGTGGVIMVNRGEGQLMRLPVLLLRARDYTHVFEYLKDQWEDVYPAMVEEVIGAVRQNRPLQSGLELAAGGVRAALAAAAYRESGPANRVEPQ